ncbi:MAG: exodeoxyribonuclease VII large subunit, partial [Acidobacteria bacterium]|nr:exodeoxyribonuclease VII large subunit [Acidobacteriota bacterium]
MNLFDQRKIYTVFDITAEIKRSLDDLGLLWIQGEISNFKLHSSGHMYFSLKDARAQIRAACFRNNNMYLKFRPEDGMEALARGRVSVYEPRGDYQFIVEHMEPVGLGSLQKAFEQLREKLRVEGLFDVSRKVPLPMLPKKVGIVTSPTGAAVRDMLRILKRRNAALDVLVYPAKVQGAGAAEEIAEGIRALNEHGGVDVIIAGRGGGSIEDLWAFNEEIVARAIAESKIPIVSAVGHETDFTIADFVADARASTPSNAAELVSGVRKEMLMNIRALEGRLGQAMRRKMDICRLSLERLSRNRAFTVAPNKIRELAQRFDEATLRMIHGMRSRALDARRRERLLAARIRSADISRLIVYKKDILSGIRQDLTAAMRAFVNDGKSRFALAVGKMDSLSPLGVLARGFALCRDGEGKIVRNASDVNVGGDVRVRLAAGELECEVKSVISDQ